MNLCKDNYLNLAEGENLIPYKCIYADKNNELVENGVDETKKMEFLR